MFLKSVAIVNSNCNSVSMIDKKRSNKKHFGMVKFQSTVVRSSEQFGPSLVTKIVRAL